MRLLTKEFYMIKGKFLGEYWFRDSRYFLFTNGCVLKKDLKHVKKASDLSIKKFIDKQLKDELINNVYEEIERKVELQASKYEDFLLKKYRL